MPLFALYSLSPFASTEGKDKNFSFQAKASFRAAGVVVRVVHAV